MLPCEVHEQQAVLEAVERVGESRGLGGLQINDPPDQRSAPQVRCEQTHALAHAVVDRAVAFVPEHTKHRGARCRLVERDVQNVDEALRPAPFAISARFKKFVIRQNVADRDRFFDRGEVVAYGERVELDVFLEIEISVVIFDTGIVGDVAGLAGGVFGKQRGGRAADELRAFREHIRPKPGVQSRIVYVANECGDTLDVAHSRIPSSNVPPAKSIAAMTAPQLWLAATGINRAARACAARSPQSQPLRRRKQVSSAEQARRSPARRAER